MTCPPTGLCLGEPSYPPLNIQDNHVLSAGFTRQGEQFVTEDYAAARRKIDLRVASSVGAVKVEWY